MNIKPFGLSRSLIDQMTEVASVCWQRGWAAGTAGNFSVCNQGQIWISPSGLCKGRLKTAQFIPVSQEGVVLWDVQAKVSEEMPAHLGIHSHLEFPRGVVLHVHPPKFVELSREYDVLKFEGEEIQKALGCQEASDRLTIPLAPNPKRHSFSDLSSQVGKWWHADANMLCVRGHGMWTWGEDPFQALNRVEALEHLCEIVD